MTADVLRNDPGNALNALKARARGTRSSRLVAAEAAGLAVALAIWIWLPSLWPVALPFLSLSAFGIWGVTDHALVAGRRTLPAPLRFLLRALRWLIVIAGLLAAVAALYIVVGQMIGTVIS